MSLDLRSKVKKQPKKAVQGKILLDRIFERSVDKGAVFLEISGIQGCGKTSLSLGFCDRIIDNNPAEIIYWRESIGSPCQFTKIGRGKYQILSERDYPIEVLEITNNLNPAPIKVIYFNGLDDLVSKAKPQMINVVYFKKTVTWIDFIQKLGRSADWQTLVWDEYEDIVPQRCDNTPPDKQWTKNDILAGSLKQLRKSRVSLFVNTQSNMDADVRVRSKIMYWIYLYGSRKDKLSPVSRGAIQGLRIGVGWVDHGHSLFGQFRFPPYLPKKHVYLVRSAII